MAFEAVGGGSLFLLVQGGRLRRRLTPALSVRFWPNLAAKPTLRTALCGFTVDPLQPFAAMTRERLATENRGGRRWHCVDATDYDQRCVSGPWVRLLGNQALLIATEALMKNLLIFVGVVFMLRGGADCLALVGNVNVASIHSAYSAGYIIGQAIAAIALVAAGAGLIKRGSAAAKSRFPTD